jgi:hypothetical protein
MTTKTAFDPDEIKACAKRIGVLLEDMRAFHDLKNHWPNAGGFALAQWLERVVDDRRNGLVAHGEHLKVVFQNMETSLTRIAEDFENADGDNADAIVKAIGELETKVTGEITTMDENTENQQHNFSDDDKVENNDTDGDGWNDNTNSDFPANS